MTWPPNLSEITDRLDEAQVLRDARRYTGLRGYMDWLVENIPEVQFMPAPRGNHGHDRGMRDIEWLDALENRRRADPGPMVYGMIMHTLAEQHVRVVPPCTVAGRWVNPPYTTPARWLRRGPRWPQLRAVLGALANTVGLPSVGTTCPPPSFGHSSSSRPGTLVVLRAGDVMSMS